MKPVLVAVWFLIPCVSEASVDHVSRTTTIQSCPDTFREAAGPFLAEGWRPPEKVASANKKVVKKKKYTRKKYRRKKR